MAIKKHGFNIFFCCFTNQSCTKIDQIMFLKAVFLLMPKIMKFVKKKSIHMSFLDVLQQEYNKKYKTNVQFLSNTHWSLSQQLQPALCLFSWDLYLYINLTFLVVSETQWLVTILLMSRSFSLMIRVDRALTMLDSDTCTYF